MDIADIRITREEQQPETIYSHLPHDSKLTFQIPPSTRDTRASALARTVLTLFAMLQ